MYLHNFKKYSTDPQTAHMKGMTILSIQVCAVNGNKRFTMIEAFNARFKGPKDTLEGPNIRSHIYTPVIVFIKKLLKY